MTDQPEDDTEPSYAARIRVAASSSPPQAYIIPLPTHSRRSRHEIGRRSDGGVVFTTRDPLLLAKVDGDDPAPESEDVMHRPAPTTLTTAGSERTIWDLPENQQPSSSLAEDSAVVDQNKAIKVLGVDLDAIERAKCLRMMGVTEDDYQKSVEVFGIFNKIDAVKSGTSASKKAQQLLGVDNLSLKLDKPFRTLGIDSENLDRDRMMALSLLGTEHEAEISNAPLGEAFTAAGALCACSPLRRRTSI